MLKKKLKDIVTHLNEDDYKYLKELVAEERDNNPHLKRERVMCSCMEEAMGRPMDYDSRKEKDTFPRAMICYQLYKEGITYTQIGWLIGKDHASVFNAIIKWHDALRHPQMYPLEMGIWWRFDRNIEEYDKQTI